MATLTNVDRDSWTDARQRLVDLGNQDALDEIDGAMFVMGLIVKFITFIIDVLNKFLYVKCQR